MEKLVKCLGYVGFTAKDINQWKVFNKEILNVQSIENNNYEFESLYVRFDEKHHRFFITKSEKKEHNFIGLDVGDEASFKKLIEKLTLNKISVNKCSADEIGRRHVKDAAYFYDPADHRVEIFYGMELANFEQPRPAGGFRTGELGYGHLVLMTPSYEQTRDFYIKNLDFNISDYILTPTRRCFMHVNERHHSIGIAERPVSGLAHLMIEVNSIDDLGRAYDKVLKSYSNLITSSLGRHSNDHMISFYLQTPSGFPIEYGWGGRKVHKNWQAEEISGPSLWGHDRRSSPPEVIEINDQLRNEYSIRDIRAPIQVHTDNDSFDLTNI